MMRPSLALFLLLHVSICRALVVTTPSPSNNHSLVSGRLGPQDTSRYPPVTPMPAWESYNWLQHVWSEKNHFFACLVPKCGSTGWLHLIYQMHLNTTMFANQSANEERLHSHTSYPEAGLVFRPRKYADRPKINTAFQFSKAEADLETRALAVLNDQSYFKFALVRHPWNRLVSAFIDKYIVRCQRVRKCFAHAYAVPVSIKLTTNVTLYEVVRVLETHPLFKTDPHFRPSVELCDVGRIPYDFIADSDNAAHLHHILAQIRSPHPIHRGNDAKAKLKADELKVACDRKTVSIAAKLYAKDLKAYGYTMDAAYESCEKYGLAFPPE